MQVSKQSQEQLVERFQDLHFSLTEHQMPVAERPSAVLLLWDIYDKLSNESRGKALEAIKDGE
jgi:hypothetical protein